MVEALRGSTEQAKELSSYVNTLHSRIIRLSQYRFPDFNSNRVVLKKRSGDIADKSSNICTLYMNIFPKSLENIKRDMPYSVFIPHRKRWPFVYYFPQEVENADQILKIEAEGLNGYKEVRFDEADIRALKMFSAFLVMTRFKSIWIGEEKVLKIVKRAPYQFEARLDGKNFWGKEPKLGPVLFKNF